MQAITRKQAAQFLADHVTAGYHANNISVYDAVYYMAEETPANVYRAPLRAARMRSNGVVFDSGSILQLYGVPEAIECYALQVGGLDAVMVYGGYYCNVYVNADGAITARIIREAYNG